MTIDQMRQWLYSAYPNATWRNKVDRMPDYQVIAVYNRFSREGRFEKKKREPHAVQLKMDI